MSPCFCTGACQRPPYQCGGYNINYVPPQPWYDQTAYPSYRTPHRCPVCDGQGNVPKGFYQSEAGLIYVDADTALCKSCWGAGVVWEPQDINVTGTSTADGYNTHQSV